MNTGQNTGKREREGIYTVGEWQIVRIPEIALDFEAAVLIPAWNEAELGADVAHEIAAGRAGRGGTLTVPVQSWLVHNDACRILIDTGIGNGRERAVPAFAGLDTDYLDRLAVAGGSPDRIDYVLCTHIHADHVGWNTRADAGRWVPTFPNARYVWGRAEGECARRRRCEKGIAAEIFADSIAPIIEAGLVDEVDPGPFAPVEGLTFHATPGHSPGHLSISLRSAGREALFGGDVLHNQVQVRHPDRSSVFCEDPALARTSRLRMLDHAADRDALFLGTHLGGTSAGRIRRADDGFVWIEE